MSAADDIRTRLDAALRQRYSVERELGRGGMATVFLAHDLKHGRSVAIKVLHPELAHAIGTERFLREIRTTGRLQHPGILALHDSGEADGLLYYIMPFVHGESLRDLLRREKRLPVSEAVRLARQVAEALAYAHAQGIVHRDIKPENILLPTRQHASLADFGLARALSSAATTPLTVSGIILGSPPYMSPEQAAGHAEVDARADIYSLGCVLFEMLTGQPPFQGPTFQAVIGKHIVQAPPRVRAHRPDVPEWLEGIVAKTMAKDPRDRFGNAEELAAALENELPGGPPSRSVRRAVRPRVAIAGLAALAAAILIVAAWPAITETGKNGEGSNFAVDAFEGSIAVLPFTNVSPDPENEYFSDGITEEILTTLAKIGDLRVISRTSIMGYKKTEKNLRTIGQELGVKTVLEGSVRRDGNQIRISAQLIDVRTDEHLWAETYDRELNDIFAVQTEIAEQIASALKVELSPEERTRMAVGRTVDLTAYQYYLRGKEAFYRQDSKAALNFFMLARELDPNFAQAYAWMAIIYANRGDSEIQVRDSALIAAETAFKLAPRLPDALFAIGTVRRRQGRTEDALNLFRQAIRISPSYAPALNGLRALHQDRGQLPEALGWAKREVAVDPTNPLRYSHVGHLYLFLGDFAAAELTMRQGLRVDPSYRTFLNELMWLYEVIGQPEKASAQLKLLLGMGNVTSSVLVSAGDLMLRRGDSRSALQYYQRAEALSGERPPLGKAAIYFRLGNAEGEAILRDAERQAGALLEDKEWAGAHRNADYALARVNAIRGRKTQALTHLKKALTGPDASWKMRYDPMLDGLRTDPDFRAIVAEVEVRLAPMRREVAKGSALSASGT